MSRFGGERPSVTATINVDAHTEVAGGVEVSSYKAPPPPESSRPSVATRKAALETAVAQLRRANNRLATVHGEPLTPETSPAGAELLRAARYLKTAIFRARMGREEPTLALELADMFVAAVVEHHGPSTKDDKLQAMRHAVEEMKRTTGK